MKMYAQEEEFSLKWFATKNNQLIGTVIAKCNPNWNIGLRYILVGNGFITIDSIPNSPQQFIDYGCPVPTLIIVDSYWAYSKWSQLDFKPNTVFCFQGNLDMLSDRLNQFVKVDLESVKELDFSQSTIVDRSFSISEDEMKSISDLSQTSFRHHPNPGQSWKDYQPFTQQACELSLAGHQGTESSFLYVITSPEDPLQFTTCVDKLQQLPPNPKVLFLSSFEQVGIFANRSGNQHIVALLSLQSLKKNHRKMIKTGNTCQGYIVFTELQSHSKSCHIGPTAISHSYDEIIAVVQQSLGLRLGAKKRSGIFSKVNSDAASTEKSNISTPKSIASIVGTGITCEKPIARFSKTQSKGNGSLITNHTSKIEKSESQIQKQPLCEIKNNKSEIKTSYTSVSSQCTLEDVPIDSEKSISVSAKTGRISVVRRMSVSPAVFNDNEAVLYLIDRSLIGLVSQLEPQLRDVDEIFIFATWTQLLNQSKMSTARKCVISADTNLLKRALSVPNLKAIHFSLSNGSQIVTSQTSVEMSKENSLRRTRRSETTSGQGELYEKKPSCILELDSVARVLQIMKNDY